MFGFTTFFLLLGNGNVLTYPVRAATRGVVFRLLYSFNVLYVVGPCSTWGTHYFNGLGRTPPFWRLISLFLVFSVCVVRCPWVGGQPGATTTLLNVLYRINGVVGVGRFINRFVPVAMAILVYNNVPRV